ncbi:MAG: hypothetical protein CSA26_01635 [Desulfobacterales bacterium]|nr:MAG: hypothetical protein CSA26_01635 [Desulfobacterales bacterium]
MTGYGFGLALRYYLIPEFLQNITALGILFISYALADSLQPESGLVSVTVFGLILANMRDVELKHILAFKETLSILLISLLFIILAARINLAELLAPGWKALLVYLVIQLVARPICIFSSTMGSTLSRPEKIFLSWIAPRGIVAAAISSLFALKLQDYGHTDAAVLVPLTFTIIILTVVIQSISALPLAKYLRIIRPPSNGVFIAGSNPVSRIIAKKLIDLGVQTMITDNSSDRRREAEKQQLPVYSGENQKNAVGSIFDIFGFKQMLAFSASENHNLAATLYYRRDFDKKHIYSILASPGKKRNMHFHRMGSPQLHSKILFGEEVSYQLLREFFESGATLQLFSPEGKYDPQLFRHRCGSKAIPLFAFDPQNRVHCFAADTTLPIDEGWKILYLG